MGEAGGRAYMGKCRIQRHSRQARLPAVQLCCPQPSPRLP